MDEKTLNRLMPDQYKVLYTIEVENRKAEVRKLTKIVFMLLKQVKKTVSTREYIEFRDQVRKVLLTS